MSKRRGFTLLEVMVALSILALTLTVIAGINATSFESSNYARQLTVATLLARSKMLDIEEELRKDGLGEDEKTFDGDFSEEGYKDLKWRALSRKVDVDVGKLMGQFLGGDVDPENLPDTLENYLAGMTGASNSDQLNDAAQNSSLSQLLGGDQIETIFRQVGDTLAESIREISLEITWGRPGIDEESVRFVQYVTTTGRLSLAPARTNLPPGQRPGDRNLGTGLPSRLPGGAPNPANPNPLLGNPALGTSPRSP